MNRKLASVQKILALDPIPGADRIEKATVLGWECVVAKSDGFKVGDLVVYVEVDSIMPPLPEFDFLKDRKYRVKTIRLKKQISQGLVLPLSILTRGLNWREGDDVTEILGVVKHDSQGDLEQKLLEEKTRNSKNKLNKFLMQYKWYQKLFKVFLPKKGGWPKFIKKTDEDRIQLFPHICEDKKDISFVVTEKIDGQSGTFFVIKNPNRLMRLFGKKYIFGVCSRNLHLPKEDNSSYWSIARKYKIEKRLLELVYDQEHLILQGEIVGPAIQGNKYGVTDFDFYAFNLIYPNVNTPSRIASEMLGMCGIKFVPILDHYFHLKPTIPEMVDYAKGKSVLADVQREGVVIRDNEGTISFKVINPEFLLKYNEE